MSREAFGGEYEAALIARLRAEGLIAISLVAIKNGLVAGQILFSDLAVTIDGRSVRSAALAPMCVRIACQRRGIGSALVRAGLEALPHAGYRAVIVLGHPDYYPRFGFSAELAGRLEAPFTGRAFMALELTPGALQGSRGKVAYAAAFGIGEPPPSPAT